MYCRPLFLSLMPKLLYLQLVLVVNLHDVSRGCKFGIDGCKPEVFKSKHGEQMEVLVPKNRFFKVPIVF